MENLYHTGIAYCSDPNCDCHNNASYHDEITRGWTLSPEEYEEAQYRDALNRLGDYNVYSEEAA